METETSNKIRILAVDDEQEVLKSYRDILGDLQDEDLFADLGIKAESLFGPSPAAETTRAYEVVTCRQGDEAVELVKKGLAEGAPFSVAFVDVRMPPGPDGAWVAKQCNALDPSLNIVIVTAYSDVPPQDIARELQTPARLFFIRKPFHWDEIHQFASALTENWLMQRELEARQHSLEMEISRQNGELVRVQRRLRKALASHADREEELRDVTRHVEEVNTDLRVLLAERERDRTSLALEIRRRIGEEVFPFLTMLRDTELSGKQHRYLDALEEKLASITTPDATVKTARRVKLSPVELKVADLIKQGLSSKEIADSLSLSPLTVESYRKTIRKKLGLTNRGENLRSYLLEYL
ncbi:MAG: hypothetical protein Kow0089_24880 [Desulfobulbaceae bacterium]